MQFEKSVVLKNRMVCLLRNAVSDDAVDVAAIYLLTHMETDYLLSYPEESPSEEKERVFLTALENSGNALEILAYIDGRIVGEAGIHPIGSKGKICHRASFGVSVSKEYWGLGIGRALTEACLECAKKAGYLQIELEVVAENRAALALYQSVGFVEYGRNPKGFLSRQNGWQTLILMRLELTETAPAEKTVEPGEEN